jgi:hypothetical protein
VVIVGAHEIMRPDAFRSVVTRGERQHVNQRGRGKQGIAFRAWIENVTTRPKLRHGGSDHYGYGR